MSKISNGVDIIEPHRPEFNKAIDFLKKDVQGLRTNRTNPELINHLLIEVYGTKTPLEQLATLNVPEPRTIVVQPWDKNIVKEIERALLKTDLGFSVNSTEGMIRLSLPPLNEERRKDLIKILHSKLENVKRSLRNIRDSIREEIIKAERSKEITEDEKYRFFEDLDKLTNEYQEEIKLIGERKEKEINTI